MTYRGPSRCSRCGQLNCVCAPDLRPRGDAEDEAMRAATASAARGWTGRFVTTRRPGQKTTIQWEESPVLESIHKADIVHPDMDQKMWDFAKGGGFCGEWAPGEPHSCRRHTNHPGAHATTVPRAHVDGSRTAYIIAWRRLGATGWRCYVCGDDGIFQAGASGMYCKKHAFKEQSKDQLDDDHERIHCPLASKPLHFACGWCATHDRPKFECLCNGPLKPPPTSIATHYIAPCPFVDGDNRCTLAAGHDGRHQLQHWTALARTAKETTMGTPKKLDQFIDQSSGNTYRVVLNHHNFPVVERMDGQDALGYPAWKSLAGDERHAILCLCALRVAAGVATPEESNSPAPAPAVGSGG